MKCQRKLSPRSACLRCRSCARFSAAIATPGLGEDAHVLGRDVLRRGDDGDAGAGLRADGLVGARGRRRRSRELPGGPLEQPVPVVGVGLVDDVGEELVQDAAEVRPFGEPDRAEVVAGDSEVGQMVRL